MFDLVKGFHTSFSARTTKHGEFWVNRLGALGLILTLLMASVLSLGITTEADARGRKPDPRKYAALVMDMETGKVLYSRKADRQRFPASLTKLMTLYMTFEAVENGKLTLNTKLKASRHARRQKRGAVKLGLKPGDTITVDQAIKALITRSSNDVAVVLAEAIGGTEYSFATMMTEKARQLGMKRTRFRNASGMPNKKQTTTARDMGLLTQKLYKDFPQYFHYFSVQKFRWKGKTYHSTNKFSKTYSGSIGMKTGYINASGFNLVTVVRRNGYRLVGVVLGARTSNTRTVEMKRIMDKTFVRLNNHPELLPQYAQVPKPMPKPDQSNPVNIARILPPDRGDKLRSLKTRRSPTTGLPQLTFTENEKAEPVKPDQTRAMWGIQIGAFARAEKARETIDAAIAAAPEDLTLEQSTIVPKKKGTVTLYRARFGPIAQSDAQAICDVLKAQEISCFTVHDTDWPATS